MDEPITRTTLHDDDERLVDAHLGSGIYASREDVVHAALAKLDTPIPSLEECAALIEQSGMEWTPEALRNALRQGIESGPPEPFDRDAFFDRMHRRYRER